MALTPEILHRLEPIRGLSSRRLEELTGLCRLEHHVMGSNPLRVADSAQQFVFLVDGELKITVPDGSMRLLVGGCDKANWPIGFDTGVPLSSKAITDIALLRIDFDLLDVMMTWDQLSTAAQGNEAGHDSEEEDVNRWRTMSGAFTVQALSTSGLSALPPAHIHELLLRFERVVVKRGDYVVRQGDPGDYYYLLESGRCEVSRQVGGVEMAVAELKAGDTFGEEALLAGTTRNATITMKTDGVLLRLAKPDFDELMRAPLLHEVAMPLARRKVENGNAIWLDVRYPAEFVQDGLAGAINVPINEIRSAFGLLDRGREYIAYCRSGRRSAAAAFLLAQHGFNASWLAGGLNGNGSE